MRIQSFIYCLLLISLFFITHARDSTAKIEERSKIPLDGRGGGIVAYYSEKRDTHRNAEIYIMNADGSAETNLTKNDAEDLAPDLSPDGSQVVFISDRDGNREISKMKIDGSNQIRLTNHKGNDYWPCRALFHPDIK
jgi:dipeptidyl aminopeptidase/acylaminoacyl peptidase